MKFKVYQHDNIILFVFHSTLEAEQAIANLKLKKMMASIKAKRLDKIPKIEA